MIYTNNYNVEAIRAIDRMIQTPQVTLKNKKHEMFSSMGENYESNKKENYLELVEEASEALEQVNTSLTFRIHKGTGRPLIQLVELDTEEVIREIPPEKMLDVLAGIWEWAGLIVDRKE